MPHPLPPDWSRTSDAGWRLVREVPGFLSENEARLLMLAAATAPPEGRILEIGSFKGRSTVGLAHVARALALPPVVAVDPHTSPSSTDPDLGGSRTSLDDFRDNLRRAGVEGAVDVRVAYSHDLAREWREPIRLLWIDGDHTYEGARADLVSFRAHLAPGAIVAMHDALNIFDGVLRVFVEDVLGSDDFGPAGFCDSIGWAQYRPNGGGRRFAAERRRLAATARHLVPIMRRRRAMDSPRKALGRLDLLRYRFWRKLTPARAVAAEEWVERVKA